MSEGGEARNHEAEVEEDVARILVEAGMQQTNALGTAARVIRALDAVRRSPQGAPGRDGDKLYCLCDHNRTYCPHTEGVCPWWDREPIDARWQAARSPQGEDHEAGIEAFKRAWDPAPLLVSDERIARAIAAYLSRCPSPEPQGLPYEGCGKRGGICDCGERPCFIDGPSPERDTEKLVETLREIAAGRGKKIAGDVSDQMQALAREALAEFEGGS